jgi:glutathione transport system substrate-binding protein
VLAEGYLVSKDGLEYTIRLKQGVKFQDGTVFKADAVKAVFDRVTNPDNKLKRYNLFNRIAKTEILNDYTVKIVLKEPFSAFINVLAHPSACDDFAGCAEAVRQQGHRLPPGRHRPFKFVEWKQTDYVKVESSMATGSRATPRSTRSPGSRWSTTTPARP